MNTKQLIAIAANFDYSNLRFYAGENPVFINKNTGEIDTWVPDTNVEIALQQNPVIYIGVLNAIDAKKGLKPVGGSFVYNITDSILIGTGEKY